LRKLLVRNDKMGPGFIGLSHFVVEIIGFRKVPLKVNIING